MSQGCEEMIGSWSSRGSGGQGTRMKTKNGGSDMKDVNRVCADGLDDHGK